jgi:hypothetical protein
MKNLEGIRISEIKESELEKKSILVNDDYNFDDCALNEKEQLQKLKENLIKLSNNQQTTDYEDYEDCRKTSK